MSWVNDLASLAGVPAGCSTLAVALYGACVAAEKSARPQALKDIARVLKSSSWAKVAHPTAIIETIFKWTFGDRQLSLKCLTRSIAVSVTFVVFAALIVHAHIGKWPYVTLTASTNIDALPLLALIYLIGGLAPDYVALAKTRFLLRSLQNRPERFPGMLIADLVLSLVISYAFLEISCIPEDMLKAGTLDNMGFVPALWESLSRVGLTYIYDVIEAGEPTWFFGASADSYPVAILLLSSTVSTSLWIVLVWISGIVIKMSVRLQKASVWFFNVEKHPVRAIGVVCGVLLMATGLAWSAIRALI
jgi:hypothetical protein